MRFIVAALAAMSCALASYRALGQVAPGLYYIHVDHLNTPRAIYDQNQRLGWRWDQSEPFGNSAPNENPDGVGTFECNLRFPGQYFDKETTLAYNIFRDYDPSFGRYGKSDPIGLRGGLNTYAYALGSPIRFADPLGLEVQICCRPAEIANGLVDHCWVKTEKKAGGMGANPNIPPGQQYEGYGMPVQIIDHSKDTPTYCIAQRNVNEQCVDDQIQVGKLLGRFLPPVNQCQSFAYGVVNACRTGPQDGPRQ